MPGAILAISGYSVGMTVNRIGKRINGAGIT
jgi:hypothetical protein